VVVGAGIGVHGRIRALASPQAKALKVLEYLRGYLTRSIDRWQGRVRRQCHWCSGGGAFGHRCGGRQRAVWGPALCFAARFVCAKNLLALLNEYG